MRNDDNLKEMAGTRKVRLANDDGLVASLPREVGLWFGWKPGDKLKAFLDTDRKRLVFELVSEEATPAAPERPS